MCFLAHESIGLSLMTKHLVIRGQLLSFFGKEFIEG
jgi:hypothetical protein